MLRHQLQAVENRCVELALFRHAPPEVLKFVGIGQMPEPEQVADFLKVEWSARSWMSYPR